MRRNLHPTDTRVARDSLGDVFELLGVSRTLLRLQETGDDASVVLSKPLDCPTVHIIADTLTRGCMNGAPILGAALWSEGMRCVGEVMERHGGTVRLRSLTDGREWLSTSNDLRAARVQEVHAALQAQ